MTIPFPLRIARATLSLAFCLGAVPASAQTAADTAAAPVYGLSDQQKEDVLSARAALPERQAVETLNEDGSDRRIHGEVGAMIGTGGARSLYGTAAIPLGENGGAIVSFENSRFGDGHRRRWARD